MAPETVLPVAAVQPPLSSRIGHGNNDKARQGRALTSIAEIPKHVVQCKKNPNHAGLPPGDGPTFNRVQLVGHEAEVHASERVDREARDGREHRYRVGVGLRPDGDLLGQDRIDDRRDEHHAQQHRQHVRPGFVRHDRVGCALDRHGLHQRPLFVLARLGRVLHVDAGRHPCRW